MMLEMVSSELKCPRNCKYTAYFYLNHYVTWVEWSPRPTINMDSTYIGYKQRSTFTQAVKFWYKKHTEWFVETTQWTCLFILRFLNLGEWQHATYLQKEYMPVYFRLAQCYSFLFWQRGFFNPWVHRVIQMTAIYREGWGFVSSGSHKRY